MQTVLLSIHLMIGLALCRRRIDPTLRRRGLGVGGGSASWSARGNGECADPHDRNPGGAVFITSLGLGVLSRYEGRRQISLNRIPSTTGQAAAYLIRSAALSRSRPGTRQWPGAGSGRTDCASSSGKPASGRWAAAPAAQPAPAPAQTTRA